MCALRALSVVCVSCLRARSHSLNSSMASLDAEAEASKITEAKREELKRAFKVFDRDGSGAISVDELAYILAIPTNGKAKSPGDAMREAKAIIEMYDTNGDGELDIEEFIEWSTKPKEKKERLAPLKILSEVGGVTKRFAAQEALRKMRASRTFLDPKAGTGMIEMLPSLISTLLDTHAPQERKVQALEDIVDAIARVGPGEEPLMVARIEETGVLAVVVLCANCAGIRDEELQRLALLVVSNAAYIQADRECVDLGTVGLAVRMLSAKPLAPIGARRAAAAALYNMLDYKGACDAIAPSAQPKVISVLKDLAKSDPASEMYAYEAIRLIKEYRGLGGMKTFSTKSEDVRMMDKRASEQEYYQAALKRAKDTANDTRRNAAERLQRFWRMRAGVISDAKLLVNEQSQQRGAKVVISAAAYSLTPSKTESRSSNAATRAAGLTASASASSLNSTTSTSSKGGIFSSLFGGRGKSSASVQPAVVAEVKKNDIADSRLVSAQKPPHGPWGLNIVRGVGFKKGTDQGNLIVQSVEPDSPFSRLVRPGDELLEIQGNQAASNNPAAALNLLAQANGKIELRVRSKGLFMATADCG